MEEINTTSGGDNNSMFSLIVKIAFVILLVFLGIKFFSERNNKTISSDNGDVERKKQKPKTQKEKI